MPAAVQSLHFEFLSGNASNGAHYVPLILEVLSGPSYSTVTRIDDETLWSTLNLDWRGPRLGSLQRPDRANSWRSMPPVGRATCGYERATRAPPELFTVPAGTQTLRFRFKTGNVANGLQWVHSVVCIQ